MPVGLLHFLWNHQEHNKKVAAVQLSAFVIEMIETWKQNKPQADNRIVQSQPPRTVY